MAGSDHYIRYSHLVRPSIRPFVPNFQSSKTNQIFTAGKTVGWSSGSLTYQAHANRWSLVSNMMSGKQNHPKS